MMRITTKGRYALRASLALARLSKQGEPVSINSLAEEEDISSVFLEQIFFKLKKAGLVNSVRGPGGGFCFAIPLEKITVKALLDAAGEELEAGFCDKSEKKCSRMGACLAHQVWTDATALVNNYFGKLSLADVLKREPYCLESTDAKN